MTGQRFDDAAKRWPLTVSAAVLAAATIHGLAAAPRARADIMNDVGVGNNGPISSAIAQMGTQLCPLFVQPGSKLASTATQMSGQGGGLAPPVAGFITQAAIQSQCPSFMSALANGNVPALMGGGVPFAPSGSSLFGQPAAPTPPSLFGQPAAPSPF